MNLYSLKEALKKILPKNFLTIYHFILAFFGALIYNFPSRKIKVIAITGTNGKTTISEMIAHLFEQSGYKIALANSFRFKIGDKEQPNMLKMTMPGRFFIQKFLRQAVKNQCSFAILEATSEGIKQFRHKFIKFEEAVFSNLSPEHIESHGGFDKYRAAKGKLFQTVKNIHIINIDDKNANYFLQFSAKKKYLYQFENQKAKIKVINQSGEILEEINNLEIKLKLPGEFNYYNALAAICAGLSQGINLKDCQKALLDFRGVPGRMELVLNEPFKVFIDYAFTPNALEKVYQTLKPKEKSMICVLGACGGGRDKWKRPVLGEIAAKYCNEIVITNEDPYDEDPYQILSMIKSGIFKSQFPNSNFYEIIDRREAIKKSLELAKPGDIVIITGKGSEPWMCLAKGKKIPWNEKKIVEEEAKKVLNKAGGIY
jgi:UDP-N-acetylmuramoyl-L-alanyl-D-glutamate--2,6-diaminopimelate ligase